MVDFFPKDMEEALQSIAAMIVRSEKARAKFKQGTSQHTLQTNRINSLQIAMSLIKKELAGENEADSYTKEELEKAGAPIASLISKSEKAQAKLAQGSWQHAMLGSNLKALFIASPLLEQALESNSRNDTLPSSNGR